STTLEQKPTEPAKAEKVEPKNTITRLQEPKRDDTLRQQQKASIDPESQNRKSEIQPPNIYTGAFPAVSPQKPHNIKL
ncbi:hypothetical protein OFB92_37135, partial [Escherichia coli]|nr:hypothetical protein [Escherichia coli]